MSAKKITPFILISFSLLLSFFMHLPHLNKDLVSVHVWRQTQTQSTIQSFYEEDFNILNPKRLDRGNGDGNFRMEFPLMQWLVAGLYKIFGPHLIISRLFMFITSIFSVIGLYHLLNTLFKNKLAACLSASLFIFSPAFFYYAINPLPDNFSLATAIWGLALFYRYIESKNQWHFYLSASLLTIATACKLPFILFFTLPGIYFLREIFLNNKRLNNFLSLAGMFCFSLIPMAWYLAVIPSWKGNGIVEGMTKNKSSWLQIFDYIQHHIISTLPELLTNYAGLPFFLIGIIYFFILKKYSSKKFLPIFTLFIVITSYFLFEINMIEKVHDYYLFPYYPLIFILINFGIIQAFTIFNKKALIYALIALSPILCGLRMIGRWDTEKPGFNVDLLTYKNELRTAVPNNKLVVAGSDISHFIFFYYINKKGWIFDFETLDPKKLYEMRKNGAEYLYSDCKNVNENPEIINQTDSLINQFGTIKIYKLKALEMSSN